MFYSDFSTFTYENTVTTAGATVTPMGSGGQLIFGCMPNSMNMQCTCGNMIRAIFAPFSRKVAPYDTLGYLFKGINSSLLFWSDYFF